MKEICKEFAEGDIVYVRSYEVPSCQTWLLGIILCIHGWLVYDVQVKHGVVRRHANRLRVLEDTLNVMLESFALPLLSCTGKENCNDNASAPETTERTTEVAKNLYATFWLAGRSWDVQCSTGNDGMSPKSVCIWCYA